MTCHQTAYFTEMFHDEKGLYRVHSRANYGRVKTVMRAISEHMILNYSF